MKTRLSNLSDGSFVITLHSQVIQYIPLPYMTRHITVKYVFCQKIQFQTVVVSVCFCWKCKISCEPVWPVWAAATDKHHFWSGRELIEKMAEIFKAKSSRNDLLISRLSFNDFFSIYVMSGHFFGNFVFGKCTWH